MLKMLVRRLKSVKQGVLRRWLTSGPTAGFNSLVLLASIGVIVELYGESFPEWAKISCFFVVFILSSLVFYVQFYRPAMDAEDEYRDQLMTIVLNTIIERYKSENPGEYYLRANVMKVRRNRLTFPRYLEIDYHTNDYSNAELDQTYSVGTGCSGWAFEGNEQTVFDSERNQEALRGMTPVQRDATVGVHSILSTPIYRYRRLDDPIGVLNLDSPDPIAQTKFDSDTMQNLVAEYAAVVGAFLR